MHKMAKQKELRSRRDNGTQGRKPAGGFHEYGLIIIGGGPAAMSAGVYAARQKLDTLVIARDIGGQLLLTTVVENWLGIKSVSGMNLMKQFKEHFMQYKIPLETDEVTEISKRGEGFIVKTGKKEFFSKAVLVATGRISKKLDVPGEGKFLGKGVSSCVTCDAPLFKGKVVAVIGTGDTATNAVLHAGRYAKKVYLLSKYPKLKGDLIKVDKIMEMVKKGKVEVFYETKTEEILGDKFVRGILIDHNGKKKILDVDGAFVEIGMLPETDIISLLEKNGKGEIIVNNNGETSMKGVFSAGDCTNVICKQLISAAGDGAKAAISAARYLDSL